MTQSIYTFKTNETGPTVAIFCGVHGNELAGIRTVDFLRNNLAIKRGTAHLVYANPRAIEQGVRFTEKNLNRCFQESAHSGNSYEEARAVELMGLLDECDALLDLHAYNEPNNEATVFAITEENALTIVNMFDVSHIITGIDEIEKGGTDGYMSNQGKIGICVELGAIGRPDDYLQLGIQTAFQFLQSFDLVDKTYPDIERERVVLKADGIYVKKSEDFSFAKKFSTFDFVKKGELLCIDGEVEVFAEKDHYLLFPGGNHPVGVEAFLTAADIHKDS